MESTCINASCYNKIHTGNKFYCSQCVTWEYCFSPMLSLQKPEGNIYIEGNIGTGKTTFLNEILKEEFSFPVITEPVEEWMNLTDEQDKDLLSNFYEDQKKWSFGFQMNSFISRIKKIEDNKTENGLAFIERSVFTDRYCFAKNCYESGKMNKIEYDIYCRWHDWLCKSFDVAPKAFIYLKVDPEISYQRIKKRSRNGEDCIPIEYLKILHLLHEEWMDREKKKGVPVLEIDLSKEYTPEIKKEIIRQIKLLIYTTI